MTETVLFLLTVCLAVTVFFLVIVRSFVAWRVNFTSQAKLTLNDLFVFVDPKVFLTANIVAFVFIPLLVLLVTGSAVIAGLAAVVVMILPRAAWRVATARRKQRLVEQMPDALTMMAGSLRAGSGLTAALEMVVNEIGAPISQEFAVLLREQRVGLTLEDSLHGIGRRLQLEEMDLFVSAVVIAKEVGGNLSEALERLSGTLRAKIAMEGKIKSLTAQGKLQGIVVGLLPIALGLALYVMDPKSMRPLIATQWGWLAMGGIAIMLLLGGLMIKKIVTIDV